MLYQQSIRLMNIRYLYRYYVIFTIIFDTKTIHVIGYSIENKSPIILLCAEKVPAILLATHYFSVVQ